MTKDKALEIALDYVLRTTYWSEGRDRHDTLKAIREALAQPEPEYVLPGGGYVPPIPLAQPEQEPLLDIDSIMEQVQVFASCWALVGSRFDDGSMIDEAARAKKKLRDMLSNKESK